MKSFIAIICLGFALLVGNGAAIAAPAPTAEAAAPTAFDPVAHKRVVEIANQLRCLVCQNQSIADSNADLAVDLRNQVVKQVAAGKSDKEIIDYMVSRYGDFVLYNPPFKAQTIILWVGPVVILIAALLAFYINLRRRRTLVSGQEKELSPEEKRIADELLSGGTKTGGHSNVH